MESTAALRRRRRRRVADTDRKRAPRACDRCKVRKNRCIETASGACQRCLEGAHPCRFEREKSPSVEKVDNSTATTATNSAKCLDQGPQVPPNADKKLYPQNMSLGQSINGDFSPAGGSPTEAFMWPRFLSRLRDAFCLDSQPAPEERDMAKAQARLSRTPTMEPAEMRRVKKAVKRFPPRPVADFLLSVCITYGTDVFFYFDQAQFTSELELFYNNQTSRLRTDTGFVCLALAVFALGSHWTCLAKPKSTNSNSVPEDLDPGRGFYNQARILMADLIDRPCLRSVQAAFVLGVYLMPTSAISASYVYMGLALRKALAIGLHLEPDEPSQSEDEKEMRRRLWWSIYSLERTVTIKLNRPRSINQDIITARLPRPLPRDSSQKFDNVQHQVANAQLVQILDRLSEPAQSELMRLEKELKDWKRSLPESLKLQNTDPKSPSYRAVFHLHLNYHFAWIDMGKVSVVTLVRARLRTVFCPDEEAPQISTDVEKAAEACIKAAKKMLALFEGLSQSGNMARFSFTDLQGCSIATIIVLLSGILERDSGYEGRVAFGLDCLRRMAGGGNSTASMGVRFVEALQSITNEARAKYLDVQSGREGQIPPIPTTTPRGYGQWAEWIAATGGAESFVEDDSLSERSEEPPPVGQVHAVEANVTGSSLWEEGADLQLPEPSTSVFEPRPGELSSLADCHDFLPMSSVDESWLNSFSDDQMYLMGLTGMDVLDFTTD
ncbi:C6 zinc finger domain protein [Colletotrichum truncatum]|uniref:C6 zinc finger domain protein n=1 Tax=Colletotrichum truncatum TaxID=5467 RepID=A0ACC3Z7C7_COLTU|nr:C6 zinc finger domain protein [Colletotrichum truncatum]KAF6785337.1 C6 zinc finger domain protein [Colletotrichum truncatum]